MGIEVPADDIPDTRDLPVGDMDMANVAGEPLLIAGETERDDEAEVFLTELEKSTSMYSPAFSMGSG